MIDRITFIKICNDAIVKTREKITIVNQVSGYLQFHQEIKENRYMRKAREVANNKEIRNSLFFQHGFISHTGVGLCQEVNEFLAVEIMEALIQHNIPSDIMLSIVLADQPFPHVYLYINIHLKDELIDSNWEVDAWDPRIIDISWREDSSIKNAELLKYSDTDTFFEITLREYKRQREDKNTQTLLAKHIARFPKPVPEQTEGNVTPRRQLKRNNPYFFPDKTLEGANRNKLLCLEGQLRYPQRVSKWQKIPS